MVINRATPDTGICFAWFPKWTPDGSVWLEWVHYRRSDDPYDIDPWRYTRMIPQDRYDAGERAQTKSNSGSPKYFDYAMANGRVVPPNVSKCAERNTNEPCRYPACTCADVR